MGPRYRKGITPIIAVILVVMITVAAASAMFFWFNRLQGQSQGTTEQAQTVLLERAATCIEIPNMTHNITSNVSAITIQNCGTTQFILGDDNDNALVTAAQSCSFPLNCTTIVSSCSVTVPPGIFTQIDINMSSPAAMCSGTSGRRASDILFGREGQQNQILLSIDRRATTSRAFVPHK